LIGSGGLYCSLGWEFCSKRTCVFIGYVGAWGRGKRRGCSPGAASRHSQYARVYTEFVQNTHFFHFLSTSASPSPPPRAEVEFFQKKIRMDSGWLRVARGGFGADAPLLAARTECCFHISQKHEDHGRGKTTRAPPRKNHSRRITLRTNKVDPAQRIFACADILKKKM